jgi:hypothetical protein
MKKRKVSTQVLLYFFMLMFLMVIGCTGTNGPPPAGESTASGTYQWESGEHMLTLNWLASTFLCNGPTVGIQEIESDVTITATTMTWTGTDNSSMTWTRSPAGTAGDPAGTWTSTDNGNTYTIVITVTDATSGTMSVSAPVIACGSRDLNPGAETWYIPGNAEEKYQVEMWYNDNPKTASAVSLTGSTGAGITDSQALTYDATQKNWAWGVGFGNTLPTEGLPWTYTFTITPTGTKTVTVSCFLNTVPTNLTPTGQIATLTPTLSWTGISATDAVYDIEVMDGSYNSIWRKENISGTSVVYNVDGTGTALISGATYHINLNTRSRNTCPDGSSQLRGSFTTAPSGGGET